MTKKIKIGGLEELISQPRLVKYDTYEFDELSYTCLLMDIRALIFENKIYKEIISKAINKLGKYADEMINNSNAYAICVDLLDILKEVEHEKSNN